MATVKKGVWDLQQVRDQVLEGAWDYASSTDPGELYLFGRNNWGNLGVNDLVDRSSPVQVPGTDWSSAHLGLVHTLAIKGDNTLWSWGYNYRGLLGQNDRIYRSSPVQVPGTQWSSVRVSDYASYGIKTDGTLWAWGSDINGMLLQNTNSIHQSSPVQVPGTQWSKVSPALFHGLGLKSDGTLWAWGGNQYGYLGLNTRLDVYSSPIQVPGTQWTDIGAGYDYTLAIKDDGTLWSWGRNNSGGLGQNNTISRSSPTQIPGTQWTSFGNRYYDAFSYVTKTDGTLWVWGFNPAGQLGLTNKTYYSSPIQLPGTQWTSFGAGYQHGLLVKNDGTAYVVGGQLGYGEVDNNLATAAYSSPTQVPGTQWSRIVHPSYANSGFIKKTA